MKRQPRGFTLIELMIVIVVVGILVAIALPNYYTMQNRAKTASVKSNMHSVQLASEDFATRNNGVYPANAASVTAEGGFTLTSLLPSAVMPRNPFTQAATVENWGAAAGTPYGGADPAGGIQINAWSSGGGAVDSYEISAEDENGVMSLILSNQ